MYNVRVCFVSQDHIINTSEDSQLQAALAASVKETKVSAEKARQLVLESDSDEYELSSDGELETFSGKVARYDIQLFQQGVTRFHNM